MIRGHPLVGESCGVEGRPHGSRALPVARACRRPVRARARAARGSRGRDRARDGRAAAAARASCAPPFWLGGHRRSRCTSSRPSVLDGLRLVERPQALPPAWLAAMAVLQVAALACLWALQRVALRARALAAGDHLAAGGQRARRRSRPAAARSARRCSTGCSSQAGLDRQPRRSAALTAANLLTFAVVLAMPVLAIPALAARRASTAACSRRALVGIGVFVVLAAARRVVPRHRPPAARGSAAPSQRVRNRLRRRAEPLTRAARAAAARARPHPRRRSARAGSARCWRRSGAGRSTT